MEVRQLRDRASLLADSVSIRLVSILIALMAFLPATVTGQSQDTPVSEDSSSAAVAESAMRVYLDPTTGQLTRQPPPGAPALRLSSEEANMLSTSDVGLVEQPMADGGYMLDLQGRFRHVAVATVSEDGSIVISEMAGESLMSDDVALSEKAPKMSSDIHQ